MSRLVLSLLLSVVASCAFGNDTVKVLMKTNMGDIELELNQTRAPKTVENFLLYADEGFYAGTIFHRVIPEFMIQGGGYIVSMKKKDTRKPVTNEAKNGMKNVRGSIAMARTRDPHSATAQFFINHADNTNLDYPSYDGWGYAVFGQVTRGMDVVDAIAREATGPQAGMKNVPNRPIVIEEVSRCPETGCVLGSATAE